MSSSAPGEARAPPRLEAVRYMGNKKALLPQLVQAVEDLAPARSLLVDPMAGSHAVGYALKHRHRILSSDAQSYSAVIGRAFVDNTTCERPAAALLERFLACAERAFEQPGVGFLERSFADTYLGRRQCRQLDALRSAVDEVTPEHEAPERWLLLSALQTAACRGQATPGHFAQFLRPDHPRTRKLREVDLFDVCLHTLGSVRVRAGIAGSVSRGLPWREFLERHAAELRPAALWYLDPPYTRDQYSRFYHFLETLVRADRPRLRFKARYRDDRFRSAFCSSRLAAGELRDLCTAIADVSPATSLLLSYSSRGLLSRDELVAAASPRFRLAWLRELPHSYSTQGKGRLDGVSEWLLAFEPLEAPGVGHGQV